MARRAKKEPTRIQIGQFWLWYRDDGDDWKICWYDKQARRTRRIATGIGGGRPDHPPVEAEQALAAHFTAHSRPEKPQQLSEAGISELLSMWIAHKDTQNLARSEQYGYSVKHWERFFDQERQRGQAGDRITLDHLKRAAVERFMAMRIAEGVRPETVHGDIAAIKRCLKWAQEAELIEAVPLIYDVKPEDRSPAREIEYSPEQVAAILEAAASRIDRQHALLFSLIMLSAHSRCEAVLELLSSQIINDRFHFNRPGRRQTTKKRPIVPVASILKPWLAGIRGKVIVYRTPIREERWAEAEVPEYFERPCFDIGKAFEACLVEAGLKHPSLDLCRPRLGPDGKQRIEVTKSGEERPMWKGIGTPNTLRHTCHTYHQTVGTPQAQIDMAAGHSSEKGSGRNYTHLRPEYLKDFMAATEAYWEDMLHYTKVHLRSHCDPTIIDFGKARKAAEAKSQ